MIKQIALKFINGSYVKINKSIMTQSPFSGKTYGLLSLIIMVSLVYGYVHLIYISFLVGCFVFYSDLNAVDAKRSNYIHDWTPEEHNEAVFETLAE